MASPGLDNILHLYQRVVSAGVLEYLQKQTGRKFRRGVYSAQVVLWLMILQRLHQLGTLAAAVQLLLQGAAGALVPNCRRVKRKRISVRTGGYCQARQKLPVELWKALEHRDGPALPKADRATPPPECQEPGHAGEGAAHGGGRLQSSPK